MPTRSTISPRWSSSRRKFGVARPWWTRYLELDQDSDWARTATRGIAFIDLNDMTLNAGAEAGKMRMTDFLFDGPEDARVTILLAHGAGAPMDSASMNATTKVLAPKASAPPASSSPTWRRAAGASRKPPPKAEKVMPEYVAAIDDLGPTNGPLIIGGKSMGGRVASMVADALFDTRRIAGLLCLGYPFHPPGKPQQLRTAHLIGLKTPTLICQGTRDEFGDRYEVGEYGLSDEIELFWLEDGDHDLKPRKAISGFTTAQHLQTLATKVGEWVGRIAP